MREVIDMVKRVSRTDFPVHEAGRRAGDPPVLVADPGRLMRLFKWQLRHSDLETICDTAYRWEKTLQSRLTDKRLA